MSCLILICLWWMPNDSGLPNLEDIFLKADKASFESILSDQIRIQTDLRPLLFDHGRLSRQQVLMAFDKLLTRYEVEEIEVTNSQADTNYSWLEVYLHARLKDLRTQRAYEITFAFHFKIAGSKIVIHRWILQDII